MVKKKKNLVKKKILVKITKTLQVDSKAVGWERNVQGKLGPRMADLGPLMDPTR